MVEHNDGYDFESSDSCTKCDFLELENIIENLSEEEKFLLKVKTIEREFIMGLIKLRKEKGLTQAVSTLENNERNPTLYNLVRYLLGIGIDINNLLNKEK